MTNKEIIEGNKLIAEFMGASFREYEQKKIKPYKTTICYFENGNCIFRSVSVENLKYHISWDWLMPVVATCLDKSNDGIDDWEWHYENIDDTFFFVDIESTWLAVIDFIKWYNKNK